jgi:hypothetical protein
MDWRELRAAQAKGTAWFRAQEAGLARAYENLEAKGREAYAEGLRKARSATRAAVTQVRDATRTAFHAGGSRSAPKAVRKPAPQRAHGPSSRSRQQTRAAPAAAVTHPILDQAVEQFLAGARGAQDALTLGAGDYIYAGARALADAVGGQDLRAAYSTRVAAERARDRYDAEHYGTARNAGKIIGTAAGLAALGPADALLAGGVRMAEAAPMVAREIGVLGGVGGAFGVGGQAISDFQRQELGTLGDYAGAAAGGATAALASVRLGPGQASAMGGAVTSVAQDALNGRPISLEKAGRASLAGGYLAAPLGYAGRRWAENLHWTEKGKLGEQLGRIRTRINGGKPEAGGRKVELPSGAKTVLDQEADIMPMSEQKFGRTARLSKGQKEAYALFGPEDYRVDHFLPRDIGALYGDPAGVIGYHGLLGADRSPRGEMWLPSVRLSHLGYGEAA